MSSLQNRSAIAGVPVWGSRLRQLVLCAGVAVALAGCSSSSAVTDYLWGDGKSSKAETTPSALATDDKKDAIAPSLVASDDVKPIAELYNAGLEAMKEGSYKTASKKFAEVERQHPYSKWATRAILMQAYSEYQRNQYDNSIVASKRFITLHPGHKDAAYAYYLIAISYYEQIVDVKRDQTATQRALSSLEEISRRFPGTAYARDAEAKAVLARDHLAGKQMEVGRYYLKKKAHLAAINRFKIVVTRYQTTSHTPEALFRLTETYMALGVRSEAQTAAAVLGHNYPNDPWYRDAYNLLTGAGLQPVENKSSWISQAWTAVNPF